ESGTSTANLDAYNQTIFPLLLNVFPNLIANDTVDGKLVALPWWTDAGVLFYRRDLLEKHDFEPPETWDELTAIARTVQQAEREAGKGDL
ncbi:MAG: extracellular solute-binding protein, partial [Oceanibaculum sp.]